VDRSAVRTSETQLAITVSLDLEALLMHRAVVSPTQQHQVRERRGSTLRPVMDVVALTKTYATAWEAATAVAVAKGSTQRRRDRARSRADLDNPSVRIVSHDHAGGRARRATSGGTARV
jgi:hypothetical protein